MFVPRPFPHFVTLYPSLLNQFESYKENEVWIHYQNFKCHVVSACITPDIFILKITRAFWHQNTFTLNDSCPLASKYSEYFTGSAPPTLYSWSYFTIGCSSPFYSWSASLIGSAYLFLYINFCFRFNKTLMNLTSLCQHHLQYTCTKTISWI